MIKFTVSKELKFFYKLTISFDFFINCILLNLLYFYFLRFFIQFISILFWKNHLKLWNIIKFNFFVKFYNKWKIRICLNPLLTIMNLIKINGILRRLSNLWKLKSDKLWNRIIWININNHGYSFTILYLHRIRNLLNINLTITHFVNTYMRIRLY